RDPQRQSSGGGRSRKRMEELRRLEEVQRMLNFAKSRRLASASDEDSNLFISNFILFLMQPYGDLDMNTKFSLVREQLQLFSDPAFQESSLSGKSHSPLEMESSPAKGPISAVKKVESPKLVLLSSDGESSEPLKSFHQMGVVQLDAMQRANSTLEDFDGTQGFEMKFMGILKTEPFQPLVLQLEHHGLLTERIREELRCGRRVLICVEDVMRAIHLKSFDYRILNLLLYQLQGEQKLSCGLFEAVMKVNDLHMDFLSISEFLVEIADDL
ncbi:unnamed protein product, partial [Linum tenue]